MYIHMYCTKYNIGALYGEYKEYRSNTKISTFSVKLGESLPHEQLAARQRGAHGHHQLLSPLLERSQPLLPEFIHLASNSFRRPD